MAFVTLTINTEAHSRLKQLKSPGDSFSDVILRELPEPWETAGDVLDGLERVQVPKVDPELRAAVLADLKLGRLMMMGPALELQLRQRMGE